MVPTFLSEPEILFCSSFLFCLILCYNSIKGKESDMDYVSAVIEAFWQYHIAFAAAVVAIIAIRVVYKMISGILKNV